MATDTANNEDGDGTTTIQVTYDVWEALDKRKDRGQSFNDVIVRLIDNTPVGFGDLKEAPPGTEPEWDEPVENGPHPDEACGHYDIISGETCEQTPEYEQEYRHGDGEPGSVYWCEEHAPSNE